MTAGTLSPTWEFEGLRIAVEPDAAPRPRPTSVLATIVAHRAETGAYRRLTLHAPGFARGVVPGQFVMISVPHADDQSPVPLLPRPMAIHRVRDDGDAFDILYATVGAGTAALARVPVGAGVRITGPLGNGFGSVDAAGDVLLLGRGVGVGSMMGLAQASAAAGGKALFVLSARDGDALIGRDDCQELGVEALPVLDADGTSGVERLSEVLLERFSARAPSAVAVCGSRRLARLAARLGQRWGVPAYVSVETHMACGLGYCHGCTIAASPDGVVEAPLACVAGPVFRLA